MLMMLVENLYHADAARDVKEGANTVKQLLDVQRYASALESVAIELILSTMLGL